MEDKAKYIAFYLPQFHPIPENDKWWGKGFTEWTNVKNAKPLYKGHRQPIVPGELGYYNLLEGDIQQKQSRMALEYGISAFCYYHYWMGGGNILLEKPAEKMLEDKNVSIPFCFCWANEDWTRSWYGKSSEILMPQLYGNEDEIKRHLEYLIPFFEDDRYLKIEGKPIFVIHAASNLPSFNYIEKYRNVILNNYGIELLIVSGYHDRDKYYNDTNKIFDLKIGSTHLNARERCNLTVNRRVLKKLGLLSKIKPLRQDFNDITKYLLEEYQKYPSYAPIVLANWDNTPRMGKERGEVFVNYNSQDFLKQIIGAKTISSNCNDLIFVKSWNEWAEGNYLEPDSINGYKFLEIIKNSYS